MLDELISLSLRDFQSDCVSFCEHHYPTIHNRGMKESHLGRALSRRLIHSYHNLGIDTEYVQLEESASIKHSAFRIESPEHQIYLAAHRLISANIACRNALVKDTLRTLDHLDTASPKEKRLIIIADHWIDRSNASKSIPSWWLGHQPIHKEEYVAQGIRLVDAEKSLAADFAQAYQLTGGKHRIFHPLFRQRDGLPLFKYMLLTATYTI
ncbi:hypothetical protein [Grimontia hollisae]|uniref:hypothetical protein n=1 Tax=Grimontia hollisae TaxID=673 RepID=UPI000E054179|nr:hypothetical protein [Grimontia hollisae]STQ76191.1 Uncharacterised protein [Grimontia hollisae]